MSISISPMNPAYFSPVSVDGSERDGEESFYAQSQDIDLLETQLEGLLYTEPVYLAEFLQGDRRLDHEDSASMNEWRRKICQWSYRVVDHFRMSREVVSVAMNFLDRFIPLRYQEGADILSTDFDNIHVKGFGSKLYQISAMTCLYLAIKLQDEAGQGRRPFRLSSFVDLSKGQFTANDIEIMERTVLSSLDWKVSTPTPMNFVSYLLVLVPPKGSRLATHPTSILVGRVLEDLARYLTELAVCLGSHMSCYLPSRIAVAAMLVGIDLLSAEAMTNLEREVFAKSMSVFFNIQPGEAGTIEHLRTELQRSLWPEMLFEACTDASSPIVVARDQGLLDVTNVYRSTSNLPPISEVGLKPPSTPVRSENMKEPVCKGSPVAVALL